MNASGRRCRQFKIRHRHLALICGKGVAGGRPIYKSTIGLTVAESIAREREVARRQMAMKTKPKGRK